MPYWLPLFFQPDISTGSAHRKVHSYIMMTGSWGGWTEADSFYEGCYKFEEGKIRSKNAGVESMAPLDRLPLHFLLAHQTYKSVLRIMTGRKPLEGLTDDEVRHRFINGDFPDDAAALPNVLFILSGWSAKFSQQLTRQGIPDHRHFSKIFWLLIVKSQDVTLLQATKNYAKAHPVLTGLQVVGTTFSVLSFFAVPVLGAIGFTAAGPAANSAAAAWQVSAGAVKAGSLFSWCQSAAMGGGALGGVQAAGVAGTVLTRVGNLPELVETFRRGFRTPNRLEWLSHN